MMRSQTRLPRPPWRWLKGRLKVSRAWAPQCSVLAGAQCACQQRGRPVSSDTVSPRVREPAGPQGMVPSPCEPPARGSHSVLVVCFKVN